MPTKKRIRLSWKKGKRPATAILVAPARRRSTVPKSNSSLTIRIRKQEFINSDAAGTILASCFPADVTTVADTNYATLAAIYENFEVYSVTVGLRPFNVGNESRDTVVTARGNMVSIIDYDGLDLQTTVLQAMKFNNVKWHDSRKYMTRTWKIAKKFRSEINNTQATLPFDADNKNGCVRFIGDNFSVSQAMFILQRTWVVRFTKMSA